MRRGCDELSVKGEQKPYLPALLRPVSLAGGQTKFPSRLSPLFEEKSKRTVLKRVLTEYNLTTGGLRMQLPFVHKKTHPEIERVKFVAGDLAARQLDFELAA